MRWGWWLGLLVLALGCGKPRAPQQPVEVQSEPAPAEEVHGIQARRWSGAWTFDPALLRRIPASPAELVDVRAESPSIATLGGHVVWLDLRDAAAQRRLASLDGPVTLDLASLDGALLRAVTRLSSQFPIEIFFEGPADKPKLEALATLTQIHGLTVSTQAPYATSLGSYADCKGLKYLDVSQAKPNGWVLTSLPPSLEELRIPDDVSPGYLENLGSLRHLKRLVGGPFRFVDLSPLQELEYLDVSGAARISGYDRKELGLTPNDLGALRHLETLVLGEPLNKREQVAPLARLPALKELDLDKQYASEAALLALDQLPNLERLRMRPPSAEHLKTILALKKLSALDLSDLPRYADKELLQQLSARRNLREFTAVSSAFGEADAPRLATLGELESLVLISSVVTDSALEAISKLTHLRRLNLEDSEVTDAGTKWIANLPELRDLTLSFTDLSDAGLDALRSAPNLRRLVIRKTRVTEQGARHLDHIPALAFLDARQSQFRCAALERPLLRCLDDTNSPPADEPH